MYKEDSLEFHDLNHRIAYIAKCTYESATDIQEAFRVALYGIGGHFHIHTDYLGFREGNFSVSKFKKFHSK